MILLVFLETVPTDDAPKRDDCSFCIGCNSEFVVKDNDLVCTACGEIIDLNGFGDFDNHISFRIKIIGKDSNMYQKDLDSSAPIDVARIRQQNISKEFSKLDLEYKNKTGRSFPSNVLKEASENYNQLQKYYVKRGKSKREIMASLLFRACHNLNFHREKSEITNFAQLPSNGMSKGDTIVRKAAAEGKIDIVINDDTTQPHLESAFEKYSELFTSVDQKKYRTTVGKILKIAEDNGICTSSQMKSKVTGILCYILSKISPDTQKKVMEKSDIRANTIRKVMEELDDYKSYFDSVINSIH